MEIRTLIDRLADEDTRLEAEKFLAERGTEVLGVLLAELADPASQLDCVPALRKIGNAAFDPLAELIASAQDGDVVRRACRAFTGLDVSAERYLNAIQHPHTTVRTHAVSMLHGQTALAHARELLPALADEDYYVRRQTAWVFASMGPDVLPLLQETRRTAKGDIRRGALVGLLEVGGPDVISAKDRVVIERFLRLQVQDDWWTFEPMHLCGGWFALRTEDQAAVLGVFGLSDPVPVTKELGADAWNSDHHQWAKEDEHVQCARAYCTAVFDGWTLVFGEPFKHSPRPVPELCAVLSKVFGEAHYYGMSCGDGWTAWCIAEDGEVIRYYDAFLPEKQIGEPLEAEEGLCVCRTTSRTTWTGAGAPTSPNSCRSTRRRRTGKARWKATGCSRSRNVGARTDHPVARFPTRDREAGSRQCSVRGSRACSASCRRKQSRAPHAARKRRSTTECPVQAGSSTPWGRS